MKRNYLLALIAMYTLSLLIACSNRQATGVSKGIDSTLTADYKQNNARTKVQGLQ